MTGFSNKVKRFIIDHGLVKPNEKILIGVSGGPDSLALLHFFASIRSEWDLEIAAAHLDHMFRGGESLREMEYVEQICKKWNVPFFGKRADVPRAISESGGNPQTVAREIRYRFFREVMQNNRFQRLALAHHGDDQIETILMRLVRGTAVGSAAGIRVSRPFAGGILIRPFLCVTREEILSYLKEEDLQPVFDSSNEKDIYTRNRYRKYVLPYLKRENPRIHCHFQQFSEELAADDDYLMELAGKKMGEIVSCERGLSCSFSVRKFLDIPRPLQRRCIQLILNYLNEGEGVRDVTSEHIHTVFRMLNKPGPSVELHLPGKIRMIRSYDSCLFTKEREPQPYDLLLEKEGSLLLPNGDEIILLQGKSSSRDPNFFRLPKHVKFPLHVRSRKNGDRIQLKGEGGKKKIKSLFIEKKIPVYLRDRWPIVTDADGEILWVPSVRKSAHEASDEETLFILQYKKRAITTGGLNQNGHSSGH